MDQRVSVDALREFAIFADHLNFTRAARELHVSQPALHVKVRNLADQLGLPLYRKEGRLLVLTPEGEVVGRFGRQVEGELKELLRSLAPPPASPIVLAAGEGAHLYLLGPAVRRLLAAGFDLRLLNTGADEAITAVKNDDAHLGVAVIDAVPRLLEGTVIASYPQVLAMPGDNRLARQRSVALSDLDGEAMVVPPPGRPHRRNLERALRSARTRWEIGVETEGWQAMLRFVNLGVGVAVVNGCVEAPAGVVLRPIVDLPPVTYTALYQPGALDDARVAAVLDAIRASAP